MFPEFEKYSLYPKSKGTITSSNTIVMKTAMKEMILNIEALEATTTDQEQIYMLTHLKVGALLLFKKEKEQIKESFDNGAYVGTYAVDKDGEEYYNQTYNQDSELPKEDKTFKRKSQWTEVDNMTKRLK